MMWREVCVCVYFFDVALDLLKRHLGIVWDPGRFRGIAPRRGGGWGTLWAHDCQSYQSYQ